MADRPCCRPWCRSACSSRSRAPSPARRRRCAPGAANGAVLPRFFGDDRPVRVLLAGGGTAGHTSPLIATADALVRRIEGVEITCLGTERGIETRVIPAAGYPLDLIP